MSFGYRPAWACLVAVLSLVLAPMSVEAQHRRSQVSRSRVERHVSRRSPHADPALRLLNRLRGRGHRGFASVGNGYLPMVALAYNRMQDPGEVALWREHIARCAQYHAEFERVAGFFQVPTAFVAGIMLHESRCRTNARDWAGGRGLAQLTSTSRAVHVLPLERVLGRRLRYRTVRIRGRILPYSVEDHLLVAMMHWAVPERITPWCVDRRGCGILGYNMNPSTFARRARRLQRALRRPPSFAEIAQTLPCIGGAHGRCPREYVARVLAASFAYQRYMGNAPQRRVRVRGSDGDDSSLQLLTSDDIPGFDPARDRVFTSVMAPRVVAVSVR